MQKYIREISVKEKNRRKDTRGVEKRYTFIEFLWN